MLTPLLMQRFFELWNQLIAESPVVEPMERRIAAWGPAPPKQQGTSLGPKLGAVDPLSI